MGVGVGVGVEELSHAVQINKECAQVATKSIDCIATLYVLHAQLYCDHFLGYLHRGIL